MSDHDLENRIESKLDRINNRVDDLSIHMDQMTTEVRKLADDNRFTRVTIVVTVIASVFASLGALWVTQANLLAAFQAGIAIHEMGKN